MPGTISAAPSRWYQRGASPSTAHASAVGPPNGIASTSFQFSADTMPREGEKPPNDSNASTSGSSTTAPEVRKSGRNVTRFHAGDAAMGSRPWISDELPSYHCPSASQKKP